MAFSGQYLANVLPQNDSPAWTRTTSGTINNESVGGGALRVGMASGGYLFYDRQDSVDGYTYVEVTVAMKLQSITPDPSDFANTLDAPGFDLAIKGTLYAGMVLSGSNQVRCEVHDGTAWIRTNIVATTTGTHRNYSIRYTGGVIYWYIDGVQVHSYSGTQYTVFSINRLRVGDISTGETVTDGYFDQVDFYFGTAAPPSQVQAVRSGQSHQVFGQLVRGEVDEDTFDDLSTTPSTSSRRNGYYVGGTTGVDAGRLTIHSASTSANLTTQRKVHAGVNVSVDEVRVAPDGVFNIDLYPYESNAAFAGIIGFADNSLGTTGYALRVGLGAGATSEVVELNAGTPTVRASIAKGVALGTIGRVKLIKAGATISAVIDGTLIAEWTDDADLVNPAYPWLGARSADGVGVVYRYDNYLLTRTNDVYVRDLAAGNAVRAYDSVGAVVASAVADANGVATLDLTLRHFPHIGHIQCFTNDTYTTTLANGRFPASGTTWIDGDDEYSISHPEFTVLTLDAHSTYATGQYGSGGAAVINGTDEYGVYMGHESKIYAYKLDTLTGISTIAYVGDAGNHHDTCSIAVDSSGYLHVAYGGGSNLATGAYKKSTNTWDISAWGAATDFSRDTGILLCDRSDNLLQFAAQRDTVTRGGDAIVHRSKTAAGAWTAGTVLVQSATDWHVWLGDAILGREASGRKSIHVAFHTIKTDASAYKVLGYIKSVDGGANWTDLAGNAITLPITQNNTTGEFTPAGVHVHTGNTYLARLGIDADDKIHIASHKAFSGSITAGTDIEHWVGVPGGSWTLTTTWLNDYMMGTFCLVSGVLAYITSPTEGRNLVRRRWVGGAWSSSTWLENTPTDGALQTFFSGKIYWVKTAEGAGGTARATFHNRHSYYGDGGRYTTGATPTYRGSASLLSMDIDVLTVVNLGAASETDTAQPLTTSKTATLGAASETDQAQGLSTGKEATLGLATETDEAQALTASKQADLGVASETDAAQALTASKATALGVAAETDAAQALTVTGPVAKAVTATATRYLPVTATATKYLPVTATSERYP